MRATAAEQVQIILIREASASMQLFDPAVALSSGLALKEAPCHDRNGARQSVTRQKAVCYAARELTLIYHFRYIGDIISQASRTLALGRILTFAALSHFRQHCARRFRGKTLRFCPSVALSLFFHLACARRDRCARCDMS